MAAALREAHEEAGVLADDVDVLGTRGHHRARRLDVHHRAGAPQRRREVVAVTNPESVRLDWTPLAAWQPSTSSPAFGAAS